MIYKIILQVLQNLSLFKVVFEFHYIILVIFLLI
uniref:Uncharacterized protein n=1 Tax=Chondria sp. (in: red algae) TaxID=1982705 RepID=A0A1Z1ME71_9FLOR|nr:hypothetical protein [Chondria sp. (in: red algae)]